MKTTIITGASSFIGMHLCSSFAERGWHVVSGHSKPLSNYTGIENKRLRMLAGHTTPAEFDITNLKAVGNIIQTYAPDLWIHHAGYAIDNAKLNFDLTRGFIVNAASIPPLFQALRGSNCGIIITGTEAEYPAGNTPRTEGMTGIPRSPYGLSKLAGTMAAEQYSMFTGVAARVARIFTPVGPMDNPGKLFPQVVDALLTGKQVKLSQCTQRRDLTSIFDIADGYLRIANTLADGGFKIFNIATGVAPQLREVLLELADRFFADRRLLRFGDKPLQPNEPHIIIGNNDKLRSLGWEPQKIESILQMNNFKLPLSRV